MPAPLSPTTAAFAPAASGRVLDVFGDRVVTRISAADTGGQLVVFEQVTRSGSGVPMHVHMHEDEVFQVLEGRVRFRLGGPEPRTIEAGAGDMIWLPRGVPHEFLVTGEMPARTLISITPGQMEGMLEEIAALPPGPPDRAQITGICARYSITFLPTDE